MNFTLDQNILRRYILFMLKHVLRRVCVTAFIFGDRKVFGAENNLLGTQVANNDFHYIRIEYRVGEQTSRPRFLVAALVQCFSHPEYVEVARQESCVSILI